MNELYVRDLLKNIGFPYLAADTDKWIDANGNELCFDDMSAKHLRNCLKMLKEQKKCIEHGIFLAGVKYDVSKSEEIIEITTRLYYNKIKEIDNFLK